MYLHRFRIENIRSIPLLEMTFEKGEEAGWHVVLGTNGSGKSSVVRAFALLVMGEKEAYASRQDFSLWIRQGAQSGEVAGIFVPNTFFDALSNSRRSPTNSVEAKVKLERVESRRSEPVFTGNKSAPRSIWGDGAGWFSASFGPYRRFSGGDRIYDRLFVSNKRLAPHLTALGEDVALTEALGWLSSLYVQMLQDERSGVQSRCKTILGLVQGFLNSSGFLPHGAKVGEITNEKVFVIDGNGASVSLDQLSDGYRSVMSMTLELVRQMFELYGVDRMTKAMTKAPGKVMAPGVVAIDEIDAHLHPTWQRDIGRWLTHSFPKVQFIVTTHSPIVCRAVADEDGAIKGSVWRLPAPGSGEVFHKIEGLDLDQLVFGDILDAFGTDLFGKNVTRSSAGNRKLARLAELNAQSLQRDLTAEERRERAGLRAIFPAESGRLREE